MNNGTRRLVLASRSPTRRRMLANAGISFEVDVANVDEDAIRTAVQADGGLVPEDLAELLARAKADNVSERQPDALVLAADQLLVLEDKIYAKPDSMDAARRQLLELSGKTHQLVTSAVLARSREVVWTSTVSADVTFRPLSPEFVGRYLSSVGDQALQSVGCYQIEGAGIQLIETFLGDYFAILGLPLLEVLEALRLEHVLDR